MISLLSRCQSSVSSAKLVLFSFHPSSSRKAFHKESAHSTPPGWQYHHMQPHRAPTCLDGSTITHTASQSTLPGWQYHHTQPHRALCCLEGSTITHSLTEHPHAWMAVPSHTASQSTLLPGGQYHHTQSHRALCLDGSTITHTASQSTLLPGGQYHE